MSEEHACLVRARSDSDSSKLGSFGTICRTMAYTDDKLNTTEASGEPAPGAAAHNAAASPPENHENESGELLDYNDSSLLDQFHEDALRQAGCGLSQLRVMVACSLACLGATLELSAIPFILPSAEIELCILPHEKNWLVLISLVGCSLGAAGWGVLAGRLGRRRALLSCLAVNAVFATIAAFMPTYGTFMMARFCSALGSGGVVPISYTYVCECACGAWRRAGAGAVLAACGMGARAAAALALHALPHTGADTLRENKEHFSAWHRYLLLCVLPILASLVSLIWTQESPRFLLEVGREVDAMMVYQTIHSSNQIRICSKQVASTDSSYRLGELSLPGKRRVPALYLRHSVKMFWQAFFQLFSSPLGRNTLCLGGTLLFTTAIQFYLSSYVPATVVKMDNDNFESSTETIDNRTFDSYFYNTTRENIEYNNCTFVNCTFRDLLMSHVTFRNCSFYDVAFSNIKSSRTEFFGAVFVNSTFRDLFMPRVTFRNSSFYDVAFSNIQSSRIEIYGAIFVNSTFRDLFMSHVTFWNCSLYHVAFSNTQSSKIEFNEVVIVNSTILDTDMEIGTEFDEWCVFNSTILRGMKGGCSRHADLTSRLGGLISEQSYVSHAMLIAALFALLPSRMRPNVALCAACIFLSPLIYIATSETALYTVEAAYRLLITVVFFNVSLQVVESYPPNLRCTAHGVILSVTYMVCCIVRGAGAGGAPLSAALAALAATAATGTAASNR